MKLVIVPPALAELHDAAAFYAESANVELGLALVAEFERAVNALLANPNLGAAFRANRRRYLLRRFPDGVIYPMTSEEIKKIREKSRVSQAVFAALLNTSRMRLQRW